MQGDWFANIILEAFNKRGAQIHIEKQNLQVCCPPVVVVFVLHFNMEKQILGQV